MNKIQIPVSNFLKSFSIFILLIVNTAHSQELTNNISLADSLFEKRKYTESLEMYENIIVEKKASPAMLLRMAYIYEGLGNLSNALISLDHYYKITADKKVLIKMKELASQNGLEGYSTSDWDYLLNSYYKFRNIIVAIFISMAILILTMIYRKKNKHMEFSPGLGFGLFAVLALIFFLVNLSDVEDKGIITGTNTYLMTGPSAGADLIEVVGEGHKVKIIDQTDIWIQIKWKGGRAFVRENNIEALL